MNDSDYPLIGCPSVTETDSVTFFTLGKKVKIGIPISLSKEIIEHCNGTHKLVHLIEYFSQEYEESGVRRLFAELEKQGVLINSRNLSEQFMVFAKNPTIWGQDLNPEEVALMVKDSSLQASSKYGLELFSTSHSHLHELLENRHSVRRFSKGSMGSETLADVLWASYGATTNSTPPSRTSPSAGGLYPTTITAVLFQDVGSVSSGIYRVTSEEPRKVNLEHLAKEEGFADCLTNPEIATNAIGALVISGTPTRSMSKYANRGFLYTLMEIGHVAQNFSLAVAEKGYGSTELGGFFEQDMTEVCTLPQGTIPFITILFGKPDNSDSSSDPKLDPLDIVRKLEEAPIVEGFPLPFTMMMAQSFWLANGRSFWSCGRAYTKELATIKARAEAIEWYSAGVTSHHKITEATFLELDHAIHPHEIVQYSPRQVPQSDLGHFDESCVYQWIEVKNEETKEQKFVLTDFVFFPYHPPGRKKYFQATSSGCAAHSKYEIALESAVLELVEREAIMVTWFNELSRTHIAIDSLPKHLQERIGTLKELGFGVDLLDITYDLAPVVMAVVINDNNAFMTCGAASGWDIGEIVDKALMEAESSVYTHFRFGASPVILTENEVSDVPHHGAYYEDVARLERASFLVSSDTKVYIDQVREKAPTRNFSQLCMKLREKNLDLYSIDLTPPEVNDKMGLRIIRVIIPGIVPITFGYNTEPKGMARLRLLPVISKLLLKKKEEDELNSFPHPFI